MANFLRHGITYRIKQHLTPVTGSSNTFYTNPSQLEKEDSFGVQTIRFPFQHKLLNLHLDASNRLYVAASGGTFTKENNHYCCSENMPAVIYISKKPLP